MSKTRICTLGAAEAPIAFAGEELARYLGRLLGDGHAITVAACDKLEPRAPETIWLGTWEAVSEAPCLDGVVLPGVDDPEFDDAIYVQVRHGEGIISGVNARSVLIAVYRFLWDLGCRWVRPGADGEVIPRRKDSDLSVSLSEAASYRHRGICIEGAVSYENVIEMIDWAPKVGYNAYFTQFRESFTFFERWYNHQENPTLEPEGLTLDQARAFMSGLRGEIARRGLLYHAVGHGWTCEPFGLPGLGWDQRTYAVSDETRAYLAEVNGVRALWGGIPLNTNLCYAQPEVRRRMNEAIADFLQENQDVHLLHYWLADGSNNQCECAACRVKRPGDWYVILLNELDALLTARGIDTRIVFLIYVDLLWPPETERLNNPDRFVLMFAPITRSYSAPLAVSANLPEPQPYVRNQLQFPRNVDENVAYLRAWQELFQGDGFDFDYHMMWDHFYDPGYYATAQVLYEDVRRQRDIGLNGYMSCQVQRAFWPSGLNMTVLGRTLWHASLPFDYIASDYFQSAYGEDGGLVRQYLAGLSVGFDLEYLRGEKPATDPAIYERLVAQIDAFRPVIARNIQQEDPAQTASWRYLELHAGHAERFARVVGAVAAGDREAALARWEELKAYLREIELQIQPVFDVFEFIHTVERRLMARLNGEG